MKRFVSIFFFFYKCDKNYAVTNNFILEPYPAKALGLLQMWAKLERNI